MRNLATGLLFLSLSVFAADKGPRFSASDECFERYVGGFVYQYQMAGAMGDEKLAKDIDRIELAIDDLEETNSSGLAGMGYLAYDSYFKNLDARIFRARGECGREGAKAVQGYVKSLAKKSDKELREYLKARWRELDSRMSTVPTESTSAGSVENSPGSVH